MRRDSGLKECTPQAQPKTRSPPCGTLCDACPLGRGAVADSAASTDKQFHVVEGANHMSLYDVPKYVDEAVSVLAPFFLDRLR